MTSKWSGAVRSGKEKEGQGGDGRRADDRHVDLSLGLASGCRLLRPAHHLADQQGQLEVRRSPRQVGVNFLISLMIPSVLIMGTAIGLSAGIGGIFAGLGFWAAPARRFPAPEPVHDRDAGRLRDQGQGRGLVRAAGLHPVLPVTGSLFIPCFGPRAGGSRRSFISSSAAADQVKSWGGLKPPSLLKFAVGRRAQGRARPAPCRPTGGGRGCSAARSR